MNYSYFFSRAWEITWRHKFLWIFGFLAALGSSEVGKMDANPGLRLPTDGGLNFSMNTATSGLSNWLRAFDTDNRQVVIVFTVTLLVGLALWLVSLAARASLITATAHLSHRQKNPITVAETMKAGVGFLKPLVGMTFLLYGPYFIVSLMVGRTLLTSRNPTASFLFAFLVLFPIGIVLTILYPLAQRAIVLQGLGAVSSISRGWQFVQDHLGKIMIIGLILFVILLIFGLVLSLVLLPFAVVTVFPAFEGWAETGVLNPGQILSIVVAGLISAVLGTVVITYQSVLITLVYIDLSGRRRKRKGR